MPHLVFFPINLYCKLSSIYIPTPPAERGVGSNSEL